MVVNSPFFATTLYMGTRFRYYSEFQRIETHHFLPSYLFLVFAAKSCRNYHFWWESSMVHCQKCTKNLKAHRVESPKKLENSFFWKGQQWPQFYNCTSPPLWLFLKFSFTKTSKSCSTSCAQNTYMTIVALKNGSIPVTFSGAKYVWQRWQKTRIFSATKGQAQNWEAKRSFLKNIIEKCVGMQTCFGS